MPAVVAEDLRRRYGETVALDGVSLSLAEGEVFALVGPNGAGKTTLVRALTGTTDAGGSVSIFGADPRDVDRQRIGVLPQSFAPHARLSARELIAYYAGLYDDPRDVESVLADVGVTDAADTWYENLSGGQKRRVCVGTTLVNDPDLLVLDEPTTGIDPAGRRSLWRLLDGLADRGVTILLTTHYMAEASELGDRVGLLADGQLVACDSPAALVAEYGGESRLTIAGQFDEFDGEDLPYETTVTANELTVHAVEPTAIGDVVATLEVRGVSYDGITWAESDLEDVYMALAGERYRPVEGEPGARTGTDRSVADADDGGDRS